MSLKKTFHELHEKIEMQICHCVRSNHILLSPTLFLIVQHRYLQQISIKHVTRRYMCWPRHCCWITFAPKTMSNGKIEYGECPMLNTIGGQKTLSEHN